MEIGDSKDQIVQRHRKEKKELQAKIQALKKTATKGDKKKKREVSDEIAKLEAELEKRHCEELSSCNNEDENDLVEEVNNLNVNDETKEIEEGIGEEVGGGKGGGKLSKAQRRREKKASEQRERQRRISEQEADNVHGARNLETKAILQALEPRGLQIHEIPSDGNCLYRAVDEELGRVRGKKLGVDELRTVTADVMRAKKDDLLPFLLEGSDKVLDDEQYDEYCNKVQSTTAWGGHVELLALAEGLKCRIEVVQGNGADVNVGEAGKDVLTLTYHRHMYGLGEHYNSVVPAAAEDQADGFQLQS